MALAIAGVGGTFAYQPATAPGTNATANCDSVSHTFAVGDLIAVIMLITENSGSVWHLASLAAVSGFTIGSVDIQQGTVCTLSVGYQGVVDIGLVQVTGAGTGQLRASRTAGTADHYTTAAFAVITGHDTTTPRPQAMASGVEDAGAGETVTATLGSAPASTSLLFGGSNMINTGETSTQATGFTRHSSFTEAFYAEGDICSDNGGGAQANAWTMTGTNTSGFMASVVEIAEAGGGGGSAAWRRRESGLLTPVLSRVPYI